MTFLGCVPPPPERGEAAAALKASQLCLRLLDASERDELRRLLAFMSRAGEPEACRLHKQVGAAEQPVPQGAETGAFVTIACFGIVFRRPAIS